MEKIRRFKVAITKVAGKTMLKQHQGREFILYYGVGVREDGGELSDKIKELMDKFGFTFKSEQNNPNKHSRNNKMMYFVVPVLEHEEVPLTLMQKQILNSMRVNNFKDIFHEGYDWTNNIIKASGIPREQARAVVSTLVKKELVEVWESDKRDSNGITLTYIGLTHKGQQLFTNGKGDLYNGIPLIKIEEVIV